MDTKSLKEFFRPTKNKMLVFIGLIFSSIGIPLLYNYLLYWGTIIGTPFSIILLHYYSLILDFFGFFTGPIPLTIFDIIDIFYICTSLFIIYSFSCLIISIYKYFDKLKQEKILKVIFVLTVILTLFWSLVWMDIEGPWPTIDSQEMRQMFSDTCDSSCKNKELLKYCTHYSGDEWEGAFFNDNEIPNELIKVGNQKWPACESRVYCFLYTPCKRLGATQEEVMKKCADLLCNSLLKKYDGNFTFASKELLEKIKESDNLSRCNLSTIPDKDNWYKRFFPENVCEKYINKTAD